MIRKKRRNILFFIGFATLLIGFVVSMIFTVPQSDARSYAAGSSMAEATSLDLNTSITSNLSSNGDEDWFVFRTTENGYINVIFNHTPSSSSSEFWRVRLLDGENNYVNGGSGYYSVYGNSDFTSPNVGLSAGTYYVRITGASYYLYSTNTYDLKVEFTPSNTFETENNNSREKADAISSDVAFNGQISSGSDVDWFRFGMARQGYFQVTFNHPDLDSSNYYWDIYIYDSEGKSIEGDKAYYSIRGNENLASNRYGVDAGTYYVKVAPYSSSRYSTSTKQYSIKVSCVNDNSWETENNSTLEKADSISPNTPINGVLSTGADEDWYRFRITRNGFFNITFNHDKIDEDANREYWYLRIYSSESSSENLDGANIRYTIKGGEDRTIYNFGVAPGVYYVKVGWENSMYKRNQKYALQVNFTYSNNWEHENNSSSNNADVLDVYTTINGALTSKGDEDWYKFNLSSQSTVSVSFAHESTGSSNDSWVLTIYNSSKSRIQYYDCQGDLEKGTTGQLELAAGTYYIKIDSYSDNNFSGLDYSLSVEVVHDHSGVWKKIKEPTCTEPGEETTRCGICNQEVSRKIEAYGHSYNKGEREGGFSFFKVETIKYTCSRCGDTYTETHVANWWMLIVIGVYLILGIVGFVLLIKVIKE